MKVRRMHTSAWRLAQQMSDPEYRRAFRTARAADLAELRQQGIVDGRHEIAPTWAPVLSELGSATVSMRVVARQGALVMHSDAVVLPGLAIVSSERRTARRRADGSEEVRAAEGVVEVALGRPDELWSMVRRAIPPKDELRADPTTHVSVDRILISEEDQARVRAIVRQRRTDHIDPREAVSLMGAPDPRLRDMVDPSASVAVVGVARGPERRLVVSRQWSVASSRLYLTSMDEESTEVLMGEVSPGHLAAELTLMTSRLAQHAALPSEGER